MTVKNMRLKTNLDEIIYGKIIESLIRGEYAVGEKIMLNDLCEKFEVSRTPVNQAVKMLSKDGILVTLTNGRVYVPEYKYDTVRQICDVRELVETYALRNFLKENDEVKFKEKLARFEEYAEECKKYLQQDDHVALAMADIDFHRAIVASVENDILTDLYTSVQGRFIIVNYLVRPLKERNYEGTVKEHFELLHFLKERDEEGAIYAITKHIGGVTVDLKE